VKQEPAVRAALSKMYRSGKNVGVLHDMKCTGAMHPLSSDVIKVNCLIATCFSSRVGGKCSVRCKTWFMLCRDS